jgi:hypothetical protein
MNGLGRGHHLISDQPDPVPDVIEAARRYDEGRSPG